MVTYFVTGDVGDPTYLRLKRTVEELAFHIPNIDYIFQDQSTDEIGPHLDKVARIYSFDLSDVMKMEKVLVWTDNQTLIGGVTQFIIHMNHAYNIDLFWPGVNESASALTLGDSIAPIPQQIQESKNALILKSNYWKNINALSNQFVKRLRQIPNRIEEVKEVKDASYDGISSLEYYLTHQHYKQKKNSKGKGKLFASEFSKDNVLFTIEGEDEKSSFSLLKIPSTANANNIFTIASHEDIIYGKGGEGRETGIHQVFIGGDIFSDCSPIAQILAARLGCVFIDANELRMSYLEEKRKRHQVLEHEKLIKEAINQNLMKNVFGTLSNDNRHGDATKSAETPPKVLQMGAIEDDFVEEFVEFALLPAVSTLPCSTFGYIVTGFGETPAQIEALVKFSIIPSHIALLFSPFFRCLQNANTWRWNKIHQKWVQISPQESRQEILMHLEPAEITGVKNLEEIWSNRSQSLHETDSLVRSHDSLKSSVKLVSFYVSPHISALTQNASEFDVVGCANELANNLQFEEDIKNSAAGEERFVRESLEEVRRQELERETQNSPSRPYALSLSCISQSPLVAFFLAKTISERLGLVHVSIEDLVRESVLRAITHNTDTLDRNLLRFIFRSQETALQNLTEILMTNVANIRLPSKHQILISHYLPEQFLMSLTVRRLRSSDCEKQGWVLDNFPASSVQAELLRTHMHQTFDAVLFAETANANYPFLKFDESAEGKNVMLTAADKNCETLEPIFDELNAFRVSEYYHQKLMKTKIPISLETANDWTTCSEKICVEFEQFLLQASSPHPSPLSPTQVIAPSSLHLPSSPILPSPLLSPITPGSRRHGFQFHGFQLLTDSIAPQIASTSPLLSTASPPTSPFLASPSLLQLHAKVILIGDILSGVSTQAELLSQSLQSPLLSFANTIEWACRLPTGDPLGEIVRNVLSKDRPVSDSLMQDCFLRRLSSFGPNDSWVVDMSPVSPSFFVSLLSHQIYPDCVLVVRSKLSQTVRRISQRRIDMETGKIYHLHQNLTIDGRILARLVVREEDHPSRAIVRAIANRKACDEVVRTAANTTIGRSRGEEDNIEKRGNCLSVSVFVEETETAEHIQERIEKVVKNICINNLVYERDMGETRELIANECTRKELQVLMETAVQKAVASTGEERIGDMLSLSRLNLKQVKALWDANSLGEEETSIFDGDNKKYLTSLQTLSQKICPRILLIGAPFAGCSQIANYLESCLHIPILSRENLLKSVRNDTRRNSSQDLALAQEMEKLMETGKPLPNSGPLVDWFAEILMEQVESSVSGCIFDDCILNKAILLKLMAANVFPHASILLTLSETASLERAECIFFDTETEKIVSVKPELLESGSSRRLIRRPRDEETVVRSRSQTFASFANEVRSLLGDMNFLAVDCSTNIVNIKKSVIQHIKKTFHQIIRKNHQKIKILYLSSLPSTISPARTIAEHFGLVYVEANALIKKAAKDGDTEARKLAEHLASNANSAANLNANNATTWIENYYEILMKRLETGSCHHKGYLLEFLMEDANIETANVIFRMQARGWSPDVVVLFDETANVAAPCIASPGKAVSNANSVPISGNAANVASANSVSNTVRPSMAVVNKPANAAIVANYKDCISEIANTLVDPHRCITIRDSFAEEGITNLIRQISDKIFLRPAKDTSKTHTNIIICNLQRIVNTATDKKPSKFSSLASKISEKYKNVMISKKNLLRDGVKLGEKRVANEFQENASISEAVILERLQLIDCTSRGWILDDDVVKSEKTIKNLDKMGAKIGAIVLLLDKSIGEEERLFARNVCSHFPSRVIFANSPQGDGIKLANKVIEEIQFIKNRQEFDDLPCVGLTRLLEHPSHQFLLKKKIHRDENYPTDMAWEMVHEILTIANFTVATVRSEGRESVLSRPSPFFPSPLLSLRVPSLSLSLLESQQSLEFAGDTQFQLLMPRVFARDSPLYGSFADGRDVCDHSLLPIIESLCELPSFEVMKPIKLPLPYLGGIIFLSSPNFPSQTVVSPSVFSRAFTLLQSSFENINFSDGYSLIVNHQYLMLFPHEKSIPFFPALPRPISPLEKKLQDFHPISFLGYVVHY